MVAVESISLYDCGHCIVDKARIRCVKGYSLCGISKDGSLNIERAARGNRLELDICQTCPDFKDMGGRVPLLDRGWKRKGV